MAASNRQLEREIVELKREFYALKRTVHRIEQVLETTQAQVRLVLVDPETGETILNFEAKNDTNYAIPIRGLNASGAVVPLPGGDSFTVEDSTNGSLASIGFMSDGVTPALILDAAGYAVESGIELTVTDADGLTPATLTVDVVEDPVATGLTLDLADMAVQFVGDEGGQGSASGTNTGTGSGAGGASPAPSSGTGVSPNTGQPVPAPANPTLTAAPQVQSAAQRAPFMRQGQAPAPAKPASNAGPGTLTHAGVHAPSFTMPQKR